ncbi:hypothetical protein GCM10023177_00420 [Streptomyces violaceoruber]
MISDSVSLAFPVYGWPQESSRWETRRRARRAPRVDDVNRIANSRLTGQGAAPGAGEVSLFMWSTLTCRFYLDEIRRAHGR